MKHPRILISTLLTAPVLLALSTPADHVAFAPEAGASVTRTFKTNNQFSLDEMEVSMNGQPMPMDLDMSMDMTMDIALEVTDTYVAVGEGRPDKLQRSFDSIGSQSHFSMEMAMLPDGGQDKSIDSSSELEGKTVEFTWNDDDGDYDVAYHESEGDEDLLEGLSEDMDFRDLLPTGDVSEGDTWDLDVKKLTNVLFPGGNPALVPELEDEGDAMMPGMEGMGGNMADMFGDLLEGEASAEYRGMKEVDGVKVAEIGFTISISSSNDMTDVVQEAMSKMPEGAPEMSLKYVDVEIEMEGEGVLHWNVAAGRVESYEIQGTLNTMMDMGMNITMGDNDAEMEQSMEMSGTFESSMAVEAN